MAGTESKRPSSEPIRRRTYSGPYRRTSLGPLQDKPSASNKGNKRLSRAEISPLRNSSFARIFWAGVASQAGSSVTNVVLVFLVYSVTHSGIDVGIVAISQTVGGLLFSLPSGTFVDRHDRKALMVLSDLIRAGCIGLLGLFLLLVGFNLAIVVAISFIVSGVGLIFQPAERSLLPSLVREESISDANGLVYSSRNFVAFGGSAGGGILIAAFGTPLSLFFNVATFLISALLLFFIKNAKSPEPKDVHSRPGLIDETKEGIKWLVSNPGLFQLTLSAMFLNFFFTMCGTFFVVYASAALTGGSVVYGTLLGVLVGGQGIGALLVGRTRAIEHAGKVWIIGYALGVGLLVMGLVFFPETIVAIPLAFGIGLLVGFVEITWLTTAQLVVPGEV